MEEYKEEDYLQLSGIQHYEFCIRQWALIHIENIWVENYLTATGRVLHNKVHGSSGFEKRGNIIIARSIKISSKRLGISGECDVVEFHSNSKGVPLNGYEGLYLPYPVEYKRGKPKQNNCDRLQLCAQAMCLEEMLCCRIDKGALFYGEPRRRETVEFDNEIRDTIIKITRDMHLLYNRQHTPKVKTGEYCKSCSIKDICLPKLLKKEKSVKEYLEDSLV